MKNRDAMKKISIILCSLLAIYSSCTREFDRSDENTGSVLTVFTAVSETKLPTKTVLTETGQIDWMPGDAIHIFKGQSDCGMYTTSITEQSETAEFWGEMAYADKDSDADFWATYPYSEENLCDGETVTVVVPDVQVATQGSFDKTAFPTIARSSTTSLAFYNICGGVKISITEPDVRRIVFRGNDGETIAGLAKIGFDKGGKPYTQSVSFPKTEITLSAPEGESFKEGEWYYIAALPTVLEKGYSVYFDKTPEVHRDYYSLSADLIVDTLVEVKRSFWGQLGAADEFSKYATNLADNCIFYTTTTGGEINTDDLSFVINSTYESNVGFITVDDINTGNRLRDLFSGKVELLFIILPNNTTSIGDDTFSGCSGLTGITIPDSVTSIGDSAFSGCSGLTSITIPNSVTSIGSWAFSGCSGLTSITIPDSVTSIKSRAFQDCTGLTDITIPDSVTSIGFGAFWGCSGLTGITIPDSVTSIGDSAFSGCSGLTSITIPNSVTSIGSWAFSGCSGLTSITIPDSVTSIKARAFQDCIGLTSITIPFGITGFGYAFYGCSNLASINGERFFIVDGSIEFAATAGLTQLIIPSGVTAIGDFAFIGSTWLTKITIPDSVISIGRAAFQECSGLKSIIIPEGVISIGSDAFWYCKDLASIICLPKNPPTLTGHLCSTQFLKELYVPAVSVDAYKEAEKWNRYEAFILAIE